MDQVNGGRFSGVSSVLLEGETAAEARRVKSESVPDCRLSDVEKNVQNGELLVGDGREEGFDDLVRESVLDRTSQRSLS